MSNKTQQKAAARKAIQEEQPLVSHEDSLKYINEIKSKLSNFGSID